jgi:hypothetical protein
MRRQAKLARSSEDKEHAMSEKFNFTIGGGGSMRRCCDFRAQCRYAWDKIGVFWKSTVRRSRTSTHFAANGGGSTQLCHDGALWL